MPRNDPLRRHRFRLEINDVQQIGFVEVAGLEAEIEPIEYRDGNEHTTVRKLRGLTKYGNVTLRWGITDSTELYDWFAAVRDGAVERRNIVITLVNEAGEDKAQWEIAAAWPCRYQAPVLDAQADEVAFEAIELAHEGFRRVQ